MIMNSECIEISFTKMTGAGNDFVIIDNRDENLHLDWEKAAPPLCSRHYGIGADGLIAIEKSAISDFKMNYYNADGSYGGMCGNGGRCSALFFFQTSGKTETTFEALDYIYSASKVNDAIALSMKNPVGIRLNTNISVENAKLNAHFINTGSPHVVMMMDEMPSALQDEISESGITESGRTIRNHPQFAPDGANVNFISINGNNTISMRTYERGVEGETLACGTGAVASAIIGSALKGLGSPVSVKTRSGEILQVSFNKSDNSYNDIILTGSAKVIFRGMIKLNQRNYSICSL